MIKSPELQYALSLLLEIGKSRFDALAETCGEALKFAADPLAIKISIGLPGIDKEIFAHGGKKHIAMIEANIKKYGLETEESSSSPLFINLSLRDGKQFCAGVIRYLGNPAGSVAAIFERSETGIFPLPDALRLVIGQAEAAVQSLLSPGTVSSLDILGRKLLKELRSVGVNAAMIKSDTLAVSIIAKDPANISVITDEIEADGLTADGNADKLDAKTISRLWPGAENIEAAVWMTDQPGFLLAFGFSDNKSVTRQAKDKIKAALEQVIGADVDYLVKSFEKLKADYDQMIKSERAAAITETAVTVNHEINNPLTAILGNTQLLLMNKDGLPKDAVNKLQTIEKSAIKIRETTNKLMTIIDPVTTHYASGLDMIDIEKSRKKEK